MFACVLVESLKGSLWDTVGQLSSDLSIIGSVLLALPLLMDARRISSLKLAVDVYENQQQLSELFLCAPAPESLPIRRRIFWFALVVELTLLGIVFFALSRYGVLAGSAACVFLLLCEWLSGNAVTALVRAAMEWYVLSDFRLQVFLSASHRFGLGMFLVGVGLLAAALVLNHWPTARCGSPPGQQLSANTTPAR